mmetsp:Transcript_11071/g.29300  ORF Transcript_11071/g.29300 Transcript_11071/m.29300 type:complete len:696 (+) Transcript_11071:92-2179(+)
MTVGDKPGDDNQHYELHVYGKFSDGTFQKMKKAVEYLAASQDHVQAIVQGYEETQYEQVVKRVVNMYDGPFRQSKPSSPLVYAETPDSVLYFANEKRFLDWAYKLFRYEDRTRHPFYSKIGAKEHRQMRESNGRSYATIGFQTGEDPKELLHFELFDEECPMLTRNFLELLQDPRFNGHLVHRVKRGGWIQAGDLVDSSGLHSEASASFGVKHLKDESVSRKHDTAGLLGMCTKGKDTSGSQFYITLRDLHFLDDRSVIIGRVVGGMRTAIKLGKIETRNERPTTDVKITFEPEYLSVGSFQGADVVESLMKVVPPGGPKKSSDSPTSSRAARGDAKAADAARKATLQKFIAKVEGQYELNTPQDGVRRGGYKFDVATGKITDQDNVDVGTFSCDPAAPAPFSPGLLDTAADKQLPVIGIADTEIMGEIQTPANEGAYFVLPSQLNGAEYPAHDSIVEQLEDYKYDNTGGPRGQLAVHPAAGQFVLDNAASDRLPDGINAVDQVLAKTKDADIDFVLVNGYLKLPEPNTQADADRAVKVFVENLHTIRPLVMEGVLANGLIPSKKKFSGATHRVSLVYSSAVPVQAYLNNARTPTARMVHEKVAQAVLVAQYFGAMRTAAQRTAAGQKRKIFLMPLGGGVFNNPWESIAKGMALAVEMLDKADLDKLDISALTWNGNPDESETLRDLLTGHNKLR